MSGPLLCARCYGSIEAETFSCTCDADEDYVVVAKKRGRKRIPTEQFLPEMAPPEPEKPSALVMELLSTAKAIGYKEAIVLAALHALRPTLGERDACCRIIDVMVERKPIYNEDGTLGI